MFQSICEHIPADPEFPTRTRRLDLMRRVLDGTLYDALPFEFHEERNASGEYIPLRSRRPSVRYALSRVVVEDSVALLFSEGHFPVVASPDDTVRQGLAAIARDCRLNQVMTEAAIRGSIGSVCVLMRILRERVFLDVLDATWLTPTWDPGEPDALLSVVERTYPTALAPPISRRSRTEPYVRHSRIRLPPRVSDGEALLGPGMKDAGFGEPVVGDLGDPVPGRAVLLTAPPERAPPEVGDVVAEGL